MADELFEGNAFEPLVILEPNKFLRQNCCALCYAELRLEQVAPRQWQAFCPEHGVIMAHNYTAKINARQNEEAIHELKQDIRRAKSPKKSVEQNLKELGF